MEIIINGETHALKNSISVTELIDHLDIAGQRFAIEINKEIVPRSSFESHLLNEGDKIEIVKAIGGG